MPRCNPPSSFSYTYALFFFLSDIPFFQLTPTFDLSSLTVSLVLIYSEERDGIHYLFHTNPSLAVANASLAQASSVSGSPQSTVQCVHARTCTHTHTQFNTCAEKIKIKNNRSEGAGICTYPWQIPLCLFRGHLATRRCFFFIVNCSRTLVVLK